MYNQHDTYNNNARSLLNDTYFRMQDNGDEIPIYANIPYETTQLNSFQSVNEQPTYQTISMRASYNQKTVLVNLIKQKLINILQAIEMTNVNFPTYEDRSETRMKKLDCKFWLISLILAIQIPMFLCIILLCLKLTPLLP